MNSWVYCANNSQPGAKLSRNGRFVRSCCQQSKGENMFVHPLARDDQHLIQDFMLTKIALLLARHAADNEWLFEMQAMDNQSKEGHGRGHPFLFIYTLARYYVAAGRLHSDAAGGTEFEPVQSADSFYSDFADAVASNDCQKALDLWEASPLATHSEIAEPPIREMAAAYLRQVIVPETELIAARTADYLPDPFVSP
ncbi:MAG: hypothetical protein WED09_12995 [Homoserinimonas sp.]